jgi:hypothetical protein
MTQTFIITADSVHWCGYEEHRVFISEEPITEQQIIDDKLQLFEEYMREYIGESEEDEYYEGEGQDEDYACVTFQVEEYNEKDHGPISHYQTLEGT